MARAFDDAATEYLEVDQAAVSDVPFVVSAWFRTDATGADQTIFWIGDKDVAEQFWIFRIDTNDKLRAVANDEGAGGASAISSSSVSVNTWHHGLGIFVTNIDRRVFLDGAKDTNGGNRSPTGTDRMSIGRRGTTSPDFYFSGDIAEVAVWDLSNWTGAAAGDKATEFERFIPSLAAGYSPLYIPKGLIAYWPLGGIYTANDGDQDVVGGRNMTAFNTPSTTDHPMVAYPYNSTVILSSEYSPVPPITLTTALTSPSLTVALTTPTLTMALTNPAVAITLGGDSDG
jgi:hypothetical protein